MTWNNFHGLIPLAESLNILNIQRLILHRRKYPCLLARPQDEMGPHRPHYEVECLCLKKIQSKDVLHILNDTLLGEN